MSRWDQLIEKAAKVLYGNVKEFGAHRIVVPHLSRYPMPYCWDTAFHVLALSHIKPRLARESIDALLSLQREDGMIPNAPSEIADQDMRSQPPLILYAAKYYLDLTGDLESLTSWYSKLKSFYEWWNKCGDPPDSIAGLVSPFSGARTDTAELASFAICSTGMDNHAVYDFTAGKTIRKGEFHYLPIEDLLLNSILAAGAKALSQIAGRLGLAADAESLKQDFHEKASLINRHMWSEQDGFYYAVDWQGNQIKVKSAQAFATLFAGVPDRVAARRLRAHLDSSREFRGRYGVRSISFDDEKFMSCQPSFMHSPDPCYWRGPIWAPITCLIFNGLLNYGEVEPARELAVRWMDLVKDAGAFAEYYYADGKPGSSNLDNFSWTAAATIYLAIEAGL